VYSQKSFVAIIGLVPRKGGHFTSILLFLSCPMHQIPVVLFLVLHNLSFCFWSFIVCLVIFVFYFDLKKCESIFILHSHFDPCIFWCVKKIHFKRSEKICNFRGRNSWILYYYIITLQNNCMEEWNHLFWETVWKKYTGHDIMWLKAITDFWLVTLSVQKEHFQVTSQISWLLLQILDFHLTSPS